MNADRAWRDVQFTPGNADGWRVMVGGTTHAVVGWMMREQYQPRSIGGPGPRRPVFTEWRQLAPIGDRTSSAHPSEYNRVFPAVFVAGRIIASNDLGTDEEPAIVLQPGEEPPAVPQRTTGEEEAEPPSAPRAIKRPPQRRLHSTTGVRTSA